MSIKSFTKTLVIALTVFSVSYVFIAVAAWNGPTDNPPTQADIPTFLNIGPDTQTKTGALGVGGVVQADGGVIINQADAVLPTCNATNRGLIFYDRGTTDELKYCAKSQDNTYAWKSF
jgi:hypothetical protein